MRYHTEAAIVLEGEVWGREEETTPRGLRLIPCLPSIKVRLWQTQVISIHVSLRTQNMEHILVFPRGLHMFRNVHIFRFELDSVDSP